MVSGGVLSLVSTNDLINKQGHLEGTDVFLKSENGNIINRTEFEQVATRYGTDTIIGNSSTIISRNSLVMDAGNNLDLQGSTFNAAGDISLKAGNDILLNAIENTRSSVTGGKTTFSQSTTTWNGVSINAGRNLELDAGRDLQAPGAQLTAGGDASLSAGRDINLLALANTHTEEMTAKRKHSIDTEVVNTLASVTAGGNARITAGQDANLIGAAVTAGDNVFLAATRDTNISAVLDSDYHYDYSKQKKSLGRSKTTENETLTQTATGGTITAGGNILVNSVIQQDESIGLLDSHNVNIAGALMTAGGDALIGARGDVTLTAVAEDSIDYHHTSKSGLGGLTGKSKSETHLRTNQIGSLVSANGDAVLMAGKDANLEASSLYAGQSAELHAGLVDDTGDINITSLQNLSFDETKTRKKSFGLDIGKDFVSFGKETRTTNDKTLTSNAGSLVLAANNITGNAGRDINVQGSQLDAGHNITLDAGRNINLLAGADSYSEGQERAVRRDGIGWSGDDNGVSVFAGNETRKNSAQTGNTQAAATTLNAGNNVSLTAQQDILIAGSDVNADNSITVDAKRDVMITTSTDTLATEERNSFTRDGLTLTMNHNIGQAVDAIKNLGKGGNAVSDASGVMRAADAMNNVGPSGSAFLGQTTTTNTHKSEAATARGSNFNAGTDVTITAGNNATVAGSQVNAQRNIHIDANDINLIAAENTQNDTTKTDYLQVGVTLQATQGNASLTAGFSKADSKLVVKDITTSGTGLNAGQDVTLIARNDINIVGSDVNAQRNITLDAKNDVNITSGQGYTTSNFDADHQSAGAGINFGSNGIGFTAYVALGENELDRKNISNRNSHVGAGENLSITSGNDTTIKGANLEGKDVNLDVGNNLTIASVQDTGSVKGKQWDISGSITVGAGVSGGASVGYGETKGSSAWVNEQTSLIGTNSVTINTKNHTQIDGALVANIQKDGTDGGNLILDTRTLGFTDLKDHQEETSTYLSAGFSTGGNPGANSHTGASPDSGGNSYSFNAQYSDLDRKQITRATLGNGTVTVREDQATGNDSLAGLNRNIDDAQKITKDKSTNIDVYYSSTAMESLKGLATTDNPNTAQDEGQQNTLNIWKNNVTSVASTDAWRVVGENGVQSLQDTGTAIRTVKNKDNLGAGDFWNTLDNTVKGTQIKNDLLRDPANRHILDGLQSKDGDEYAAAMVELGHLAQDKFGVSLSDIMLYDAGKTTSSSLADTFLRDVFGGTVLEGNQQGNMFVDAGDGKTKTDMVSTLGHEVYENQTFQTNGVNDNKQEDLANAFGEHLSNRINQASGNTLNSTGGSDFNVSLQNSNAIKYGTERANDVGNAQVDNRSLMTSRGEAAVNNLRAQGIEVDPKNIKSQMLMGVEESSSINGLVEALKRAGQCSTMQECGQKAITFVQNSQGNSPLNDLGGGLLVPSPTDNPAVTREVALQFLGDNFRELLTKNPQLNEQFTAQLNNPTNGVVDLRNFYAVAYTYSIDKEAAQSGLIPSDYAAQTSGFTESAGVTAWNLLNIKGRLENASALNNCDGCPQDLPQAHNMVKELTSVALDVTGIAGLYSLGRDAIKIVGASDAVVGSTTSKVAQASDLSPAVRAEGDFGALNQNLKSVTAKVESTPNSKASDLLTNPNEAFIKRINNIECVDCDDLARDFYKATDGTGKILDLSVPNSEIKVYELGKLENFVDHRVYTDGKYVFDPRFSKEPVPIDKYLNDLKALNPNLVIKDVTPK